MSRSKTRPVVLSPAERSALTRLVRAGSHPAQQVRRARILLELDEGDPDREGPVPLQAVLAVYARPVAPARPVVGMEEEPYPLLARARGPIRRRPGTRPQGRLRVRPARQLLDLGLDPTAGRPQTRRCPAQADPHRLGRRD